jgi:ribosomal protein S12 methylthiotransferase accessory factor
MGDLDNSAVIKLFPSVDRHLDNDRLILNSKYNRGIINVTKNSIPFLEIIEELKEGLRYTELTECWDPDEIDILLNSLRERGFVYNQESVPDDFNLNLLEWLAQFDATPELTSRVISKTDLAFVSSSAETEPIKQTAVSLGFGITHPQSADLLVLVIDESTLDHGEAVDHSQTPVIPLLRSTNPLVGPVLSDRTVCYDCYQKRRSPNSGEPGLGLNFDESDSDYGHLQNIFQILIQYYLIGLARETGIERYQIKFDILDAEMNSHLVLPIPGCSPTDLQSQDVIVPNDSLISNRTGIVNSVEYLGDSHKFNQFHMYSASSTTINKLENRNGKNDIGGFSVDHNKGLSRWKAVGEAVERYSMSWYNDDEFVIASREDLDNYLWQHPYRDCQYAAESFPYRKLSPEEQIEWVIVEEANTGNAFYAPAFEIYQPFPGEPFKEVISTGTACHIDQERALLEGLLEVIERDAIAITFFNNLCPPKLSEDIVEQIFPDHISALRRADLVPHVVDISLDTEIPCYLAVATDNESQLSVGAGCDPNPKKAAEKALEETMATYYHLTSSKQPTIESKDEITNLHDHMLYYQGNNHNILVDKLEEMETVDRLRTPLAPRQDLSEQLQTCIEQVQSVGMEVYAKDITPPDVAKSDFVVTRVIIPEAVDINVLPSCRRLRLDRIKEVPQKVGYNRGNQSEVDKAPHPFP